MKSIRVATCQFSVEPEINHNRKCILRQIQQAAYAQADIVHFSECALSGYAGVDIPDHNSLCWEELIDATREIQSAAKAAKIWVLLGSTHRLSGKNKPHNSIYIINPQGEIVDRYDKRFCTGTDGKRPTFDMCHYTPGNHRVTFCVKGIKCGVLICYDYRFPELFRDYKREGAAVIFQSFHNARKTVVDDESYNIWKTIVPATMTCWAAENHFWISANNSQSYPSCWSSFTVRPDGQLTGRLKLHRPGVLITEMALDPKLYDAPAPWRESAMNGKLHSGRLKTDVRSADRTCL